VASYGADVSVEMLANEPAPKTLTSKRTEATPAPESAAVAASETAEPPTIALVAGTVREPVGIVLSTRVVREALVVVLPPPSVARARRS
jgi:hypothetical protein